MLTQEYLKYLLQYDPETGVFLRRVNRRRWRAGEVAGREVNGYVYIQVGAKAHLAHRLAFLYMEGAFPPDMVDHINGNRNDNRWCNLRHATRTQNARNRGSQVNSKTGVKGVHLAKKGRPYVADIRVNGRTIHLGAFDTIAEAKAAYDRAASDKFGDFANIA